MFIFYHWFLYVIINHPTANALVFCLPIIKCNYKRCMFLVVFELWLCYQYKIIKHTSGRTINKSYLKDIRIRTAIGTSTYTWKHETLSVLHWKFLTKSIELVGIAIFDFLLIQSHYQLKIKSERIIPERVVHQKKKNKETNIENLIH